MNPSSYQTGYVGHVHHKVSTYVLAHLLKKTEVNAPRIGARTGNNQFGAVFSRQSLDLLLDFRSQKIQAGMRDRNQAREHRPHRIEKSGRGVFRFV
jgi:hypothetical protein